MAGSLPVAGRADGDLERLDRELGRLARGSAALRLLAGEALESLCSKSGHHTLGFSSAGAYAKERIGRSGRWVAESRMLARRLARMPRTRAAVLAGELSWSKAEVLGRHVDALDDVEGRDVLEARLLDFARSHTVRELRARITDREREAVEREDDVVQMSVGRKLRILAPVEDTWGFEAVRRLIEQQHGGRATSEQVLEAMLAEGLGTLLALAPDLAAVDLDDQRRARARAERERLRKEVEASEQAAEARIAEHVLHAVLDLDLPEAPDEHDPRAVDGYVRVLVGRLDGRELELGRVAGKFLRSQGHHAFGYATEAQYARERLGMSRSALLAKVTLARRLERLPEVAVALSSGGLGVGAASLVARVAGPFDAGVWLERARRRTYKHLDEEVRAVELLRRRGEVVSSGPPDAATLEAVQRWERGVLSGRGLVQMSVGRSEARRGFSAVTLTVSDDLVDFYRALEREFERCVDSGDTFLRFLTDAVWDTWRAALDPDVKYGHIHRRDRHRCAAPTCERTDVTPHHLRFRSQGGGEEHENLLSLCAWCHLQGVHEGRLFASPPASDVRWRYGSATDPLLTVQGRELLA